MSFHADIGVVASNGSLSNAPHLRLRNVVTYSIFRNDTPIPVICDSLGVAINTACKLLNGGASECHIKGSDGFMMEHRDIEIECLRRGEGNRQGEI
jgi:hypothetical protein